MSGELIVCQDHKELRAFLEAPTLTAYLGTILPPTLTPQRLVRQVLTLAMKTPKLLECTKASLWGGVVQAAELGLELNGVLGQAYLVPRWNGKVKAMEATFQVGYRGLVALAFRSGKIASFPTRTVYKNDTFSVAYGSHGSIRHEPKLDGDRGEVIGYYAVAAFANYGHDFEFMTVAECKAHREKYAANNPTWDKEFDEMSTKTCVRKLSKRLPQCVEAQHAAMLDEYHEKGIFTHRGEAPLLPVNRSGSTDALADRLALAFPEDSTVIEAPAEPEPAGSS